MAVNFDDESTGVSYQQYPKDPLAREQIQILDDKVEQLKEKTVSKQEIIDIESKVRQSDLDKENFKEQVNTEVTTIKGMVEGLDGGNLEKISQLETQIGGKANKDLVDNLYNQIEDKASTQSVTQLTSQLAETVKEVNGAKPVNGKITIPIPEVDKLATKTELANVAGDAPKGVYNTLADLQTAYPTGTTGKFIVGASGAEKHWYIWANSQWVDGGVYQGIGVPDDAITPENLSKKFNYLQDRYKLAGKRLTGYDPATFLPTIDSNANYVVMKIPSPKTGTLKIFKPVLASGQAAMLGKLDGTVYPMNVGRTILDTVGNKVGEWLTVFDTYYEIYIEKMLLAYPQTKWIYLGFPNGSFVNAYIYGMNTLALSEIEWLNAKVTVEDVQWNKITGKPIDTKGFVVPPHIPCVIGKTEYIYLDNVLRYGDFYTAEKYVVKNKLGLVEGGYPYSPVAGSTQETLTLEYYNGSVIEKQATIIVKPVPVNAGSGVTKKCLIIGESTTNNAYFVPELGRLFESDVMKIKLLGSTGTAPYLHEGRSGWSTNDYLAYEDKGRTNAFYNPTTSKFDFTYYMSQMGYDSVDYVFIDMGINDASENIPSATTLANYTTFLNSIKAFNSNIKVFFGLTSLPSKWKNQYYYAKPLKDTVQALIQSVITQFGNREGEGIFLTPIYTNIDPFWDMPYEEVAISTRNPRKTYIGTDSVHQSPIGYYKKADTYFNMIKYVASLG